jgi:Hpt domain-containing protein
MAKSLIDLEELLDRTENDRELMRDLLAIFKEEFPQRHGALREAIASLNAPPVALEAHALKGMLSNLAAVEAAAASRSSSGWGGTTKRRNFLNPFHVLRPSRKTFRDKWRPAWPRCLDENPDRGR